ncbi:hypothetical protein CKO50_14630 [Pseudoalteromonas sp. HM-SA03]|uniref:sulfotransferase domain-containing protein n=1 Tax=Pseudoalteromonas sp. HM-SA03 TaxID=2029678 RepID=UPI000BAE11B7|nr:sulfotransferase domain-containing protein [Pseudoalteromonas sp. HM-SA03]PAY00663.1 hypothetical protein CKO50_14630 [Pseudoalteromonas sp. HM-SA03]
MIVDYIERFVRGSFEVPKNQDFSCVVLASFPKSGNTWFRFVTSNILASFAKIDPVDFHSIRYLSPEIRGNRCLEGVVKSEKAPTFLKTHFYNVSGFNKYPVVVLFREPVKTFQSYFDYMKNEQGKSYKGFLPFLNSPRVGIDSWLYFHDTWMRHKDAVFVSYDELIKNQFIGLKTIYKKLGFEIDDEVLERAIIASSRENMARIEKESGDPSKKNAEYNFVGNKDGRHGQIEDEIRNYILSSTSEVYQKLMNKRLPL